MKIIDAHAHVVQYIAGFTSRGELRGTGGGMAAYADGTSFSLINYKCEAPKYYWTKPEAELKDDITCYRHGNRIVANVAFFDGHVSGKRWEALYQNQGNIRGCWLLK